MSTTWWRITFTPTTLPEPLLANDFLDALGFELIELGALSTALESPPDVSCFVRGTKVECDGFLARTAALPLRLLEVREVDEKNWNKGCPEVWIPVYAEGFCIVPVTGCNDPRPTPPGALKIIPGQGFGTGHHATTKMVLEDLSKILSQPSLGLSSSSRVLDFGTGSGVLAIAAAARLGARVDATDIDLDALANAKENAALNGTSDLIHFSESPLSSLSGVYDLLLANVYAEVLVSARDDLSRLARSGAYLLMSGVTELVKDHVIASFCQDGRWSLVRERCINEWMGIVLHRR
jgi:ribosomal protein L11 methyltransferase